MGAEILPLQSLEEKKQMLRETRDAMYRRAKWHHTQRNACKDQAIRAEYQLQDIERKERLG